MSSPTDFEHHSINYIEFAANNLKETKLFFEEAFQWEFTDYGEEYTAFTAKGLMGILSIGCSERCKRRSAASCFV